MKMTRLFPLLVFVAGLAACNGEYNSQKPNIIFIMADDMGYADLSSYGCTSYETPNIDRLAMEGMMFTNAYSGCTVCAPARSTLMTGKHMGHAPVRGNTGGIAIPDETLTLAELLSEAGYICGGFGKWGLGDIGTEGAPEKQGFDEFYGYYHQIHAHQYYPEYLVNTGKKEYLPGNKGAYDSGPKDELQHTAFLIFERTMDFIRKNKDKPFFCYAPWTPPHARYELPENDPDWLQVKDKIWSKEAKGHAAFNLMLDRHVGELIKLLDELGLADNTLVIFCSDNGASHRFDGELNSTGPFRGSKTNMYEGGLRVPFIARWPGKIEAGSISDLPLYFPDMMPTLAEVGMAEDLLPDDIDGNSLVPELTGEGSQIRHEVMYWEYPVYNFKISQYTGVLLQAVRSGDLKMVRHDQKEPWELYNLAADPGETTDLAAEQTEMILQLEEWIMENRTEMIQQIEPEKPDGLKFR